jgi:hypothetical protein
VSNGVDPSWALASGGAPAGIAALHKVFGMSYDLAIQAGGSSLNSGKTEMTKVPILRSGTISTVLIDVVQAGSGATALANCYVGVYNSAGTLLGLSADMSNAGNTGNWLSTGIKQIPVTVQGGQSLAVTAADGAFVYVAILCGTESTTPFQPARQTNAAGNANWNVSAMTDLTYAQDQSVRTSLPAPMPLTSLNASQGWWAAIA